MKKEFMKKFNEKNDAERIQWLMEKGEEFPDYTINLDNDIVFITFNDEGDSEDPIILKFNNFGNVLLRNILRDALKLPSEFV